jgi:hypothetical protein
MEDPRYVSGPVSMRKYKIKSTNVYLFGDVHFSSSNQCSNICLSTGSCKDIVQFIRDFSETSNAKGRSLDIFMEFPYVDASNIKFKNMIMGYLDKIMYHNKMNILKRIIPTGKRIGVFERIYQEFRNDMYGVVNDNVRFHNCDARFEIHAFTLSVLDPVMFQELMPTTKALRELLEAIIFSDDFPRDVQRVMGATNAKRFLKSKKKLHPIAEKMKAVKDAGAKRALISYLNDRLDDIINVLDHDLGYNNGPYIDSVLREADNSRNKSRQTRVDTILHHNTEQVVAANNKVLKTFWSPMINLVMMVMLMDAYLLCSMVAQIYNGSDEADAIVYVGEAHAVHYHTFIRDYLKINALHCTYPESINSSDISRCVPNTVDKRRGTRDCYTLGKHPNSIK